MRWAQGQMVRLTLACNVPSTFRRGWTPARRWVATRTDQRVPTSGRMDTRERPYFVLSCILPMPEYTKSHATLRVHPERESPEELQTILLEGLVAHVAIVDDGVPVVIPMTYHYEQANPNTIYVHGATFGRLAPVLAAGAKACVTVTMLDGLVFSKTAKYHSMNYRSAVCFGSTREVTDRDEKRRLGDALIARYHPGRTAGRDFGIQPDPHVDATVWAAIDITYATAKVRRGGPKGPGDGDPAVPGTSGVIEFNPHR